ncbi:MAG: hypothetical protein OEM77_03740 [Nitrosopumilus sp.]|nr:hypothetical protein [Nitrosopumilus sp.]MDH3735852.1 hypothetical protein [Nitrosopumilus sp.]MDH3822606.1 hypothetical protein [Nitrosopumilus sp.]MDH3833993.1 hypothetical protein [Nitrosopumilus sp.]
MDESDEIQKLIDDISFRKSNSKDYKKMRIEEISKELRDVMKFEQESIKKIEEFEKIHSPDLIKYAKILCKNTTEREIKQIQEIYLEKIDKEYLSSK